MDVISDGLRFKGEDIPERKEIKNVSSNLAERWFDMGFAHPKPINKDGYETATKPDAEKKSKNSDDEDDTDTKIKETEYPKHTGSGWYELSNGEKVQGREEAIKSEKELG